MSLQTFNPALWQPVIDKNNKNWSFRLHSLCNSWQLWWLVCLQGVPKKSWISDCCSVSFIAHWISILKYCSEMSLLIEYHLIINYFCKFTVIFWCWTVTSETFSLWNYENIQHWYKNLQLHYVAWIEWNLQWTFLNYIAYGRKFETYK